jgi:hypothetical protein
MVTKSGVAFDSQHGCFGVYSFRSRTISSMFPSSGYVNPAASNRFTQSCTTDGDVLTLCAVSRSERCSPNLSLNISLIFFTDILFFAIALPPGMWV